MIGLNVNWYMKKYNFLNTAPWIARLKFAQKCKISKNLGEPHLLKAQRVNSQPK